MSKFSTKDVLKLAELSSLKLEDNEVEELAEKLAQTIAYTAELDTFQAKEEHEAVKTINVFREDKARPQDSAPILAQAPQTEETYFVVPKILDQS